MENTWNVRYLGEKIITTLKTEWSNFLILLKNIIKSSWGKQTLKILKITILSASFLLGVYLFIFWFTPTLQNVLINTTLSNNQPASSYFGGKQSFTTFLKKTQRETEVIENKLRRLKPTGSYLVINTIENHFYLFSGNKVVHEGICSTGSYVLLKAGENQQWIFHTPKGMSSIHGKAVAPIWKKPDWAFIEEGLPVPPKDSHERFEAGVLGDYALSLGDGYLIHGTLFQRFLGLPVTHGCVRLGDNDLKKVYSTLSVGSKVYIY